MGRAERKHRVLFLCTGNSCRSQMAEGFARAMIGARVEAWSAGTLPHGVNPLAVRAMSEAGVDITAQRSKRPEEIAESFDVVVTLCDGAHGACPHFPGARVIHAGFDDPPRLARGAKSDDEAMPHYRRVRDEIRAFIESLPALIAPFGATTHGLLKGVHSMTTSNPKPCCGPDCCKEPAGAARAETTRDQVREGYAKIAQSGGWSAPKASSCCGGAPKSAGGGCCGPATFSPEQLASAIGYSAAELGAMPEGANMGLSCGNPTALASLRPGEVVLDLGAGGGFDCFVAGPKVGATGKVIGVDMTPDMLTKARANIAAYSAQTGLHNVEFRLGEIENLPVADASVDVVISNCVLNLSPDKSRVWKEIARVLKPGGRVAVSDLALLRPLPAPVLADVEALVGCVSGAVLVEETRAQASAAGLTEITLTPKSHYIDAMTNWEDPLYVKIVASLPSGTKPSDFVTSLDVSARKPA